MAAAASLVIKNAAAADITFTVDRVDGDSVRWVYKPTGTGMSEWVYITIQRQSPKNKVSGALVGTLTIEIPKIDATTKLPLSTNRSTDKVVIPVKAPQAVNDDMAAFKKNLVADSVVQQFLKDGTLPT